LFYSIEGRNMEIITISSMDGITDIKETLPQDASGLYPDSCNNIDRRPFTFEGKRTVFFTSRVHPGETPGSHVLNGVLDILSE
jgi:hypothetical protein